MRLRILALVLAILAAPLALPGCGEQEQPPREFFGMDPQALPGEEDVAYMRAGGVGAVRWALPWGGVQQQPGAEFDWTVFFDPIVTVAAKQRLRVLPFLLGTPQWLADPLELPVANRRQRDGWRAFIGAAVARYGPDGSFWREHGPGSEEPLPRLPIREWQIWNEPNFFYFVEPVSPRRYAALVRESHRALSEADPGARLILGGLFADPPQRRPKAIGATEFLAELYEVPGIAAAFDGIALHPYAHDTERLEEMTEAVRDVAEANGDEEARLHITEMGWGSQSDSGVGFEVGPEGQARELRASYEYLIGNRENLNLDSVFWFSWKDLAGSCSFCDSSGLFEQGPGFAAKPAWPAFVEATGGRRQP